MTSVTIGLSADVSSSFHLYIIVKQFSRPYAFESVRWIFELGFIFIYISSLDFFLVRDLSGTPHPTIAIKSDCMLAFVVRLVCVTKE